MRAGRLVTLKLRNAEPAGTMKSKTSENLIASESKAGIKRDGADDHKQKQLKKGKGTGWDTPQKPTNRFLEATFILRSS